MKVRTGSALLLLALCGCRMCQDPWDYSGPVQGSPSIPYGATTTRSGSVLNGGPAPASSPTAAPDMPQPPTMPSTTEGTPSPDPMTLRPGPSDTIRR